MKVQSTERILIMKEKMIIRVEELNKILEKEGKSFRVKYVQQWKTNEMKDGYVLSNSDHAASPIIYDDDVIGYMEKILKESNKPNVETIMQLIKNEEYVKANIYPSLLSLQKNINNLEHEDISFIPVEDMAITFYITVEMENGTGKIRVKNDMLKTLNLAKEQALIYAKENLSKNYDIVDIEEMVKKEMGIFYMPIEKAHNDFRILVITTKDGDEGAALMLIENIMEEISKCLSSKFLIIPSSIHEFIAIPYQTEDDIKQCRKMVHKVNSTVVSKNDYLSDNVFIWKNGGLHKA